MISTNLKDPEGPPLVTIYKSVRHDYWLVRQVYTKTSIWRRQVCPRGRVDGHVVNQLPHCSNQPRTDGRSNLEKSIQQQVPPSSNAWLIVYGISL
jgi:hypothetical protein